MKKRLCTINLSASCKIHSEFLQGSSGKKAQLPAIQCLDHEISYAPRGRVCCIHKVPSSKSACKLHTHTHAAAMPLAQRFQNQSPLTAGFHQPRASSACLLLLKPDLRLHFQGDGSLLMLGLLRILKVKRTLRGIRHETK